MLVVLEIPRNISGEDSEVSKQIRRKGNERGEQIHLARDNNTKRNKFLVVC